MQLQMFCIHDRKAGFFMTPFFFPSLGQAVRAFGELATDLSTTVGRHPGDFALYELGSFDDQSGVFTLERVARFVTDAQSCLPEPPRQPPLFAPENGGNV